MLFAAACCPHPPVLVPKVAGAAASELDGVRTACHVALRRLFDTHVQSVVVVGGASTTTAYDASAAGSLGEYGVDIRVGAGKPVLPLSLTVGRWLLEWFWGRPLDDRVHFHSIEENAPTADCLALGANLSGHARVGMVVMGDGAVRHHADGDGESAHDFDTLVARALASADATCLAELDIEAARRLTVTGRAAWQVLAGAAGDQHFVGELLADTAPYGTGYLVASWHS